MPSPGPRAAAKAAGKSRYFTGVPCKRGHVVERNVSNASCSVCSNEKNSARRAANPEKHRFYAKRYRDSYPDRCRESTRKWQGLPVPTRPMPAVCERPGCGSSNKLALDHCHKTNTFRGWLCFDCNTSIGKLGDDINGLLSAISYLQHSQNHQNVLIETADLPRIGQATGIQAERKTA